jgi:hypothetical protein
LAKELVELGTATNHYMLKMKLLSSPLNSTALLVDGLVWEAK